MSFVTCDVCDAHEDKIAVVTGHNWFSYGVVAPFPVKWLP